MTSSIHTRTVRRLVIDVEDFDDFRARYEAAAPAYDLAGRIGQLSNWDDVSCSMPIRELTAPISVCTSLSRVWMCRRLSS